MREIIAALDNTADILESEGFIQEAYRIDRLANLVEAALVQQPVKPGQRTYMPQVKNQSPFPMDKTLHIPPESDRNDAYDIILKNRDTVGVQLEAIHSSLDAIKALLEQMTKEAVKRYPERNSQIKQDTQKNKQQLESLYQKVHQEIMNRLKAFWFSAGGMEEMSKYEQSALEF